MNRFRLVGGPNDGEVVDELPEGYVDMHTESLSVSDLDEEDVVSAEYEG